MKVKDLIKLLEKQNQEANIYVACEGYTNLCDDECTRLYRLNQNTLILSDTCHIDFEQPDLIKED